MTVDRPETRSLRFIRLDQVAPNPRNPRGPNVRENDQEFESLRESVRQFGVLVPLVVRQVGAGSFELIDGERRYHAAKSLRLEEVPAIIITDELDDTLAQRTMFQIHANWSQWNAAMQCRALEPLYGAATAAGESDRTLVDRIVADTGLDARTTRNRLQFIRWPVEIKNSIYDGTYKNAYWYVVEIEDKIIEPGMRNFPEYFEVVQPEDARRALFEKYQQGLVRAAVQVRRAALIATRPASTAARPAALALLGRLVSEPDYSFEEAHEDYIAEFPDAEQDPPPSPRNVLTQVRRVLDVLAAFLPAQLATTGRGQVTPDELASALGELAAAASRLEDEVLRPASR
jgi:hypothetical protein